jgi:hypothetical protein
LTSHKLIDNLPSLEKVKKDLHTKWKEKYSNLDSKEEPGDMNEDGNEKVLSTQTQDNQGTQLPSSLKEISQVQQARTQSCRLSKRRKKQIY